MKVRIEHLTPEIAQQYLSFNKHNRPIDYAHVKFLATQMAKGAWVDNGQPIQFTVDGDLCNGQHRLHAIIKSGIPQSVVVVRDVPREAFKTIDVDSKPRTLSVVLQLAGYKNAAQLAAGTKMLTYFLPTGDFSDVSKRMSSNDAERIIDAFPELEQWAKLAKHVGSCPFAPSVLIACSVMFGRSRWQRTSPLEFFNMLKTGADLPIGSPALTVRNRATRIKMSGGIVLRKESVGMIIRAWNSEQVGKQMRQITASAKIQRIWRLPKDFADKRYASFPED